MRRLFLPMSIILIALSLQGWAFFENKPLTKAKTPIPRRLNLKPLTSKESLRRFNYGVMVQSKVARNQQSMRNMSAQAFLQTTAVYQTDIDGDHKKDLISYAAPNKARGVDRDSRWVDLYLQRSAGEYHKISFWSYHGEIGDFVDMNGDGRYEVTILSVATFGDQNFWAYNLFELVDDRLKPCVQYEGFPLFAHFSPEHPTGKTVALSRQAQVIHARTIGESVQYQTIHVDKYGVVIP